MDLLVRLCLTLLGIFVFVCLLKYECKELDGYKFPVYSTQFCPRNQTEWNERSSATNCTKDNGYLCFPNEKFTQLLEFCYRARFIWIQEGYCLYLRKDDSTINSYSCSNFQSGCHNSSFPSYDLFKHPSCTSIGTGCFLAEPSCIGIDTTIQPPETTDSIHVEIASMNANRTLKKNDFAINDEVTMIPILYGALISISSFCIAFIIYIIYKKGIQLRKRRDDEEHSTETALERSPFIQTDKRDNAVFVEKENSTLLVNDDCETQNELVIESEHDRAIFKQWIEDNEKFVSTRACEEVKKLIESQNLVIVTGNSGSGKSAIIKHIALCKRMPAWTVKPVASVMEIVNTFQKTDCLRKNTIFVLEDPIGKVSLDEIEYKLWEKNEYALKTYLKTVKLLVSCRKYILSDQNVKGLLKKDSNIVDLTTNQLKMNTEEKRNILMNYISNNVLSEKVINEIVQTEEYFPLLCKLFLSEKDKEKKGLQFFKQPVKVIENEIFLFRSSCKEKYGALVLLILFNDSLFVEDIDGNEQLNKRFKHALALCGIKNTPPSTIGDTLKTLDGFLVKKIGYTYHFYHDLIMEATTYVFGKDYPRVLIQYADIGFLRRRVNLESSNDNKTKMVLENGDQNINISTICLPDIFVEDLGERLLNEIFGEHMLDVVLNPCMRNDKVAAFFIQILKKSPDKLNSLLAKAPLHKIFTIQGDERTSFEQSFTSKLDFFYGKKMPILSYVIIFCHINLSRHCLETLQQTQSSIKSKYLFSAVCCNGSMDLFNVFTKEQIKMFVEMCGQYNPIYIASLFHNHEILRELIWVKNDMNLESDTKWWHFPLMMAALYSDERGQNNKESGIQSIDITLELLMTHGADINYCHPFYGTPLHIASFEGNDCTVKLLLSKGAYINSCDTNKETPLHTASTMGFESTVHLLLKRGADINLCDKDKQTPLHKASEKGNISTVQLLLDKKADINSCDKYKETPLHKASTQGFESTVKLLLDRGANINSRDINKQTPLYKSSLHGNKSTVQLLLDREANINLCDANKETPLHTASERGHESTVQLLLDKGGDINSCDTNKQTPLHKASKRGHECIVQLLIHKEADINSYDQYKETPLHKASEEGHENIVKLLLQNGGNIYSCDKIGATPINKATEKGHASIVQLLLSKRTECNVNDFFAETPLHKAGKKGQNSTILGLLKRGADINVCDKYGKTPLHEASEKGHNTTVHLLLRYGAVIDVCDQFKETPLHKASKKGHDIIVQLLLDKGADVDSNDRLQETPLYKASKKGYDKIVQLLLNNDADNKSCVRFENTSLHKASEKGHQSIVQFLLRKGANVNLCNSFNATPLHTASRNGHESIVQLLISKGANVNVCNEDGETPLHKASEEGHESIVQLLIRKDANKNVCDEGKETPLHKASTKGYDGIVQLLLGNGANVNVSNVFKQTPLYQASREGHESTVQLLLSKEANVNSYDEDGETPLHKASENGHESIVRLLLSKEANVNSCNVYEEIPLHKAGERGHYSIVQLLLSKNANFNSCDKNGETPLHKATKGGDDRIVELLISKGANVNSCDGFGNTPLHRASIRGHKSTVQLLLSKGANVNSCDEERETPLNRASEIGHESIVQLLLSKEANVNLCNVYEEIPLHKAGKRGHYSIVQLLLSKNANVNSCDENGETPLHKASLCGHESIVQLLLSKGANINSSDEDEETSLHIARKVGHLSNVQLLSNKGADVKVCDEDEETSSLSQ